MSTYRVLIGLTAALVVGGLIAADPRPRIEDGQEILRLDTLADPSRWNPSECTVQRAEERRADDRPTLHLHIPVDFNAGQKAYPIGWPRMYCDLKRGFETDWVLYDRFEFRVYVSSSRDTLPERSLNFQMHCPDKGHATFRKLAGLTLDEWVTISVPTAEIPHVKQIARLGFNISESDHQDGDVLDFYLGDFKLIRSATCTVTEMTARAPAIYADRALIPLDLVVAGPPEHVSRGVPFTLRRGDTTLRVETLPVKRGRQALQIDVTELRLAPGTYELAAFDNDPERRKQTSVQVVSSPWEDSVP